jgi:hypothetical protein
MNGSIAPHLRAHHAGGTENKVHDAALVQLDTARQALVECRTAMEAKQVADAAEAARVYLERTNASVEMVNRAREIQVLAEQQMGAFLKTMEKSTGAMGIGTSAVVRNDSTPPTLSEMGISRDRAARAQKLAEIPAEETQERIAVLKASGEQPTPAKVLQLSIRNRHPRSNGQNYSLVSAAETMGLKVSALFSKAKRLSRLQQKQLIYHLERAANTYDLRKDWPGAADQMADLAIAKLEDIPPDHPARSTAIAKVSAWIADVANDTIAAAEIKEAAESIRKATPMTEAQDLWLIAKGRLDNIRENDPERESVLRLVVSYAQRRLDNIR